MSKTSMAFASLVALVTTLIATGIHHIFRLGPALLLPTAIGIAVPVVLWVLYARTGKQALLWAYTLYAALVVFWFGLLDGFLDHVAKAAGMDNITFLPGSEEEIVTTAIQLWSPSATTAFYEGTGILSAALAFLTVVTTGLYLYRELPARSVARTEM
nr:hypothetical protein [uncultured Devosia sp.]